MAMQPTLVAGLQLVKALILNRQGCVDELKETW